MFQNVNKVCVTLVSTPHPLEYHILFEWFLMKQDKKEGRMKVESILKISLPVLDDYDPIRRLCRPHPTTESNLQVSWRSFIKYCCLNYKNENLILIS